MAQGFALALISKDRAMFASRWLLRSLTARPPAWWQTGWPRQRVGSVAEAELLSQLAVLLMPKQPISELFRRFPSPEGWRGHYLDPDLSAYGVLKNPSAALFVEYDGYWRHGEKEGMEKDEAKNAALLAFAPAGSHVIRISHTAPDRLQGTVLWVQVSPFPSGDQQALGRTLGDILTNVQAQLHSSLKPSLMRRWKLNFAASTTPLSAKAISFTQKVKAAAGFNTLEEISVFLTSEGYSGSDLERLLATLSSKTISIEQTLKPALDFLLELGLSKDQAAKAVNRHPQILGYCVKKNLKPTVQWLLVLGLSKAQVAKAVAGFPQILGLSIEQNLKPTVQWLLDLGLSKVEVAKAVACFPQILSYSMEQNFKPTVQWLLDLGLSTEQVSKAVAQHPRILGYSIEQKLKPTVRWLFDLGLSKDHVARGVASYPRIMGFSLERNLKPSVQWLLDLGLNKVQVAKAVALFPKILCYSIEQNLKPTVQWLLDLGMSKAQVAKAVAVYPQLLGLSIGTNLDPKFCVLHAYFGRAQATSFLSKWPQLVGYSLTRLTGRLKCLEANNKADKLLSAMPLTEDKFTRRFCRSSSSGVQSSLPSHLCAHHDHNRRMSA